MAEKRAGKPLPPLFSGSQHPWRAVLKENAFHTAISMTFDGGAGMRTPAASKQRIRPEGKASQGWKAERTRVREPFKTRDTAADGFQAAVLGVRGGLTTASPVSTRLPSWLSQVVSSLTRPLAVSISVTSTRAVIVSPILTAPRKVSSWRR